MKKLAIFVEGLTEQILVRQMLQAVLDREQDRHTDSENYRRS